MSESHPQPQNEQTPNIESIPVEYRQRLLEVLEQNMPLPYTQEDMERQEEDVERMHGYNECRDEVLEMLRKVLGGTEGI